MYHQNQEEEQDKRPPSFNVVFPFFPEVHEHQPPAQFELKQLGGVFSFPQQAYSPFHPSPSAASSSETSSQNEEDCERRQEEGGEGGDVNFRWFHRFSFFFSTFCLCLFPPFFLLTPSQEIFGGVQLVVMIVLFFIFYYCFRTMRYYTLLLICLALLSLSYAMDLAIFNMRDYRSKGIVLVVFYVLEQLVTTSQFIPQTLLAWSLSKNSFNSAWFGLSGALVICHLYGFHFQITWVATIALEGLPPVWYGLFGTILGLVVLTFLLLIFLPGIRPSLRLLENFLFKSEQPSPVGTIEPRNVYRPFSAPLLVLYSIQLLQILSFFTADTLGVIFVYDLSIHIRFFGSFIPWLVGGLLVPLLRRYLSWRRVCLSGSVISAVTCPFYILAFLSHPGRGAYYTGLSLAFIFQMIGCTLTLASVKAMTKNLVPGKSLIACYFVQAFLGILLGGFGFTGILWLFFSIHQVTKIFYVFTCIVPFILFGFAGFLSTRLPQDADAE